MVSLNTATRVGLNILLVFGVIVVLRLGATVFLPLIIALLLAAVLGPAALWLHQRLKFNWTLACTTMVMGLIALFVLISLVFVFSLPRLVQVLPKLGDEPEILSLYNNTIRPWMDQVWPFGLDEDLFPKEATSSSQIRSLQLLIETAQKLGPELIVNLGLYALNWFWQWILVLFILFFLLLEGGMLIRRLVEIFGPSAEVQDKARAVLYSMSHQVNKYLVWRTVINFWLAIVIGSVFQLIGLNQAWTWALLLAILNYIPYLGPLIAVVPPFVDALITVSPGWALVVLIVYTTIIVIEGYLIVPLVMGRSMELNATTVMMACLFWDLVWGTMGLFLAMPLMAALKAVCYHVPGWRPWANLMSTGEEEPRPMILKKEPAPQPEPDADGRGAAAPAPGGSGDSNGALPAAAEVNGEKQDAGAQATAKK